MGVIGHCVLLEKKGGFFIESRFSITFTNNHGQQGGHAVYATPIYNFINCLGIMLIQ